MDYRRLRRGPRYQSRGRSGAHGQRRRSATRTGHRRNSKTPQEEPAARSQKTQISDAGRPLTRRIEKSAAAGRTVEIPAARRFALLQGSPQDRRQRHGEQAALRLLPLPKGEGWGEGEATLETPMHLPVYAGRS